MHWCLVCHAAKHIVCSKRKVVISGRVYPKVALGLLCMHGASNLNAAAFQFLNHPCYCVSFCLRNYCKATGGMWVYMQMMKAQFNTQTLRPLPSELSPLDASEYSSTCRWCKRSLRTWVPLKQVQHTYRDEEHTNTKCSSRQRITHHSFTKASSFSTLAISTSVVLACLGTLC